MPKSRNQIWAQSGQGQSQTSGLSSWIRPSLNQLMEIRIEEKGKTMTSGFAVRPLGTIMPGLGHVVGMCGGHPLPNVLLNPEDCCLKVSLKVSQIPWVKLFEFLVYSYDPTKKVTLNLDTKSPSLMFKANNFHAASQNVDILVWNFLALLRGM